MTIEFKETFYGSEEIEAVRDAIENGTDYLSRVRQKLINALHTENIFLTTNGSLALDLLLLSYDFPRGGEVILPSFTYPSAANSILRMGLKPVFCDINTYTLVMDIDDAREKATEKTVCVIPTHYAGVSVDLEVLKVAFDGVCIIEDAALSIGACYRGQPLGTLGNAGIISFHKTKNISSDEGGVLIINDESIRNKMDTIYDNGTDRRAFFRGEIPHYQWQTVGMNAGMSNISAAILYAQLDKIEMITKRQLELFDIYMRCLMPVAKEYGFELPQIPAHNKNNAHVFYIVFRDENQRNKVKIHLRERGIDAFIHYVPLHQSSMGAKLGCGPLDLPNTHRISQCLLRLPMHARLMVHDCETVAREIGQALCKE